MTYTWLNLTILCVATLWKFFTVALTLTCVQWTYLPSEGFFHNERNGFNLVSVWETAPFISPKIQNKKASQKTGNSLSVKDLYFKTIMGFFISQDIESASPIY